MQENNKVVILSSIIVRYVFEQNKSDLVLAKEHYISFWSVDSVSMYRKRAILK
jgi:hypothetical protein